MGNSKLSGGSVVSGSKDSFIASIRSNGRHGTIPYSGKERKSKDKNGQKEAGRLIIDEDGFLVSDGNQQDQFLNTSTNSFTPDFIKNNFEATFFSAPTKEKKKKGSSRKS